jgi:hypothetical protein
VRACARMSIRVSVCVCVRSLQCGHVSCSDSLVIGRKKRNDKRQLAALPALL